MNMREKIFAALMASNTLIDPLAKDSRGQCLYHCRNPNSGRYPVLVYSVVADVPAVIADGVELVRRVTIRISILTSDGVYEPMYQEIIRIMLGLGFMRVQTTEEFKNSVFIKSVDFRISVDMED